MSYMLSDAEFLRRAASYIDRVLRGARLGDLPVEQPSKFHLMVNLKTAKALGLTISKEPFGGMSLEKVSVFRTSSLVIASRS